MRQADIPGSSRLINMLVPCSISGNGRARDNAFSGPLKPGMRIAYFSPEHRLHAVCLQRREDG